MLVKCKTDKTTLGNGEGAYICIWSGYIILIKGLSKHTLYLFSRWVNMHFSCSFLICSSYNVFQPMYTYLYTWPKTRPFSPISNFLHPWTLVLENNPKFCAFSTQMIYKCLPPPVQECTCWVKKSGTTAVLSTINFKIKTSSTIVQSDSISSQGQSKEPQVWGGTPTCTGMCTANLPGLTCVVKPASW